MYVLSSPILLSGFLLIADLVLVGDTPVPQPFDVAIGARQIFTLASQFIVSCPQGSNLNIQPFPSLVITNAQSVKAGSILKLAHQTESTGDGVTFCSFSTGSMPTQFVRVVGAGCMVPDGLTGEVFVTLTKSEKSTADVDVIAG